MKKTTQYLVLRADSAEEITRIVNEKLQAGEGWKLRRACNVSYGAYPGMCKTVFAQTLVRRYNPETQEQGIP